MPFDRVKALREGAFARCVLGKPNHIHPAFNGNPGKTHKDPRNGESLRFAARALELAARARESTSSEDAFTLWAYLLHGEPDPLPGHVLPASPLPASVPQPD